MLPVGLEKQDRIRGNMRHRSFHFVFAIPICNVVVSMFFSVILIGPPRIGHHALEKNEASW